MPTKKPTGSEERVDEQATVIIRGKEAIIAVALILMFAIGGGVVLRLAEAMFVADSVVK